MTSIQLLKNSWHGHSMDSEFCGPDSRELYQHNLVAQPEDWPWRTRRVHYGLNSQNYRCPEFDTIDWADSVLMFGCSYVFGCGLDDTDTMAYVLNQRTGLKVVNLAQGATDDMFQWINSNILYAAGVRPRAVIYVWPGMHRLTELKGDLATWNWGSWNAQPDNFGGHWVTNERHVREYLHYLSLSVRNMWSCPVLEYYAYLSRPEQWGTIRAWGHVLDHDQARDLGLRGNYHPGPRTNAYWVDEYLIPDMRSLGIV